MGFTRVGPDLPLYDSRFEHDACGVGFIAARDGAASHRMTRLAVECLRRLDHRGAKAADGTGDGAGLMTQVPVRLLRRDLAAAGIEVGDEQRIGVLMCFLPPADPGPYREIVRQAVEGEGGDLVMWRQVPIDPSPLSERARSLMPVIEQALVVSPSGADETAFERILFLARKRIERLTAAAEDFTIPSASGLTVVYKGLFAALDIADFYWDLADPDYETAFAIFHQRYSTNTFPSWHIAQPFRALAHNGEINTVTSNRSWTLARENAAVVPGRRPTVWGERIGDIRPFLQSEQSDSGSLDNLFELLIRSGRDLAHTKEILIPAAWENVADLTPELRAFHEYQAFLAEPWDGPAAIAATDGIDLLAGLDRNGLRPARWAISADVVLVASEAGVCPEEESRAERTGQLGPGEMLVFERRTGRIRFGDDLREELAARAPYEQWIANETLYVQSPFDNVPDDRFDAGALCRTFGYTAEERRLVLADMAEGKTPVGSMGNDTALAALSVHPRRSSHFCHQLFAQVTNPPMDPIREQLVMSLRTYLGSRGSLLDETPGTAHLVELSSPILSNAELEAIVFSGDPSFFSHWIAATWAAATGPEAMEQRLVDVCDEAEEAVRAGATIVVLSDREVDAEYAPLPITFLVGAVHHRLIQAGIRMQASILVVSGEPRDSHDLAMLIAAGASAVNPYLAIDQVSALPGEGIVRLDPVVAQENYRSALQSGLLKVMSKMGISTVSAYRGSELFEVVGVAGEVADLCFRNAPRRTGGLGFADLAARVLELHSGYAEGEEFPGGFYKQRRGGADHVTNPGVVLAVQRAVRSGEQADWGTYIAKIEERPVMQLRDLLRFSSRRPVPLAEVESADRIMRRFVTSAMSLGALSPETHEALSEAMNQIGALSNSGEGGESSERFGTSKNSAIKQVASGRFGVTPGYLASAEELQIKMAQGSKPGEGGQIPGHKVTEQIAALRHTEPGVSLISPPPHHDIYSIEDLAQLIYDLKAFKPSARVSVKLVSEPGVGTVAVGVAKAQADGILISGAEGGTGASPLESIKHAGSPWELGLAEAHQVLVANGLRSSITLETDGGLRTGKDVVIAALLGAERFGFGTLPLMALGCKMVRQCHLNTCPVGIATQNEDLRAKFTGAAEQVVVLFRMLAEEVRSHLASLGARTLGEVIGRADLLEPVDHPMAAGLASVLVRAEGRLRHPGFRKTPVSKLSQRLLEEAAAAIESAQPVALSFPVSNVDRTVGAGISGAIAARYGDAGLPPGTITVRLSGAAGQSLGAWMTPGIDLRVSGVGNDYVGKGMGGGRIVIVPRRPGEGTPHAAGNAVLYGATAGEAFLAGTVGQRFAVRNSGATAVVEGCSDHGCEYMTGGVAVVLGPVGRNFGAGMTGGSAFVWDPQARLNRYVAETSPSMHRLGEIEEIELRDLIGRHVELTGSPVAAAVLDAWERHRERFWVLRATRPVPLAVAGELAGTRGG
jgi:glutamate synthase domain-containing protein 2/glutamate synthase domain-containing protein 1/glutamate synthase domain-containing protein 3